MVPAPAAVSRWRLEMVMRVPSCWGDDRTRVAGRAPASSSLAARFARVDAALLTAPARRGNPEIAQRVLQEFRVPRPAPPPA